MKKNDDISDLIEAIVAAIVVLAIAIWKIWEWKKKT
jgi:hypothetical protein